MNILVTGGAGFIGSHVADGLIAEGHRVTIIDNLVSGKKENVNPSAIFKEMDIRDKGVESVFNEGKFDAVFHLAAQIDVRKSVEDPAYDADVNIIGGLNLLENSVKYGVKRFVFISSGGVMYGESADRKPTEEEQARPVSPYGSSKLALENYLIFYKEIHSLDSVVLRFGNVYGPRQDPHGEAGVVAIFSGAMLAGVEVKIFGDGNQLRDYVYVEDVMKANLLALETGSGVYNIGTGESESVNELFRIMKDITAYGMGAVYKPPREGELQVSRLDVSRAQRELGWKAEVDFKEGLRRTVEYFKDKN